MKLKNTLMGTAISAGVLFMMMAGGTEVDAATEAPGTKEEFEELVEKIKREGDCNGSACFYKEHETDVTDLVTGENHHYSGVNTLGSRSLTLIDRGPTADWTAKNFEYNEQNWTLIEAPHDGETHKYKVQLSVWDVFGDNITNASADGYLIDEDGYVSRERRFVKDVNKYNLIIGEYEFKDYLLIKNITDPKVINQQMHDKPEVHQTMHKDWWRPDYTLQIDELNKSNGAVVNNVRPKSSLHKAWYTFSPDRYNEEYMQLTSSRSSQNVTASLKSGGLSVGIGAGAIDPGIETNDFSFGDLTIGQQITPIEVESFINLRDLTGGNGWTLSARNKDATKDNSLQLELILDSEKTKLGNDSTIVAEGSSRIQPYSFSGGYAAEWGTNPKVEEFKNEIEWTASLKLSE